jgi:protein phosphatase
MMYDFFALTDPGLARDNNEDAVTFDAACGLGVLADGMGGYNAGEVASGMATAFIKSELSRWLKAISHQATPKEVRRAMEICVENANRAIYNAANAHSQYAGMGTTLVVAVFQEDWLMLGHIGDSRCYRLRRGVLRQMTKDHSLLQEQLDAGVITAEQLRGSSNKNLVTRALGVDKEVVLEVNEYKVEPSDLYLLCSDGLSDMVDDTELAVLVQATGPLDTLATRLVNSANASGGRDNIAVLLVSAQQNHKRGGLWARLLGK